MKTVFSILLLFFACSSFKSQTFVINSATSQDWAGGVCCSSGTNYQISLSTENTDKKIRFDSLWIGQKAFALNEKDGYSVVCNRNAEKTSYTIHAGISYNRHGDYDSDKIIEVEKKPIEKAPSYSGVALIIYHVNKERKVLEIASIKELPYLAYP